jgi:hypothetical protein
MPDMSVQGRAHPVRHGAACDPRAAVGASDSWAGLSVSPPPTPGGTQRHRTAYAASGDRFDLECIQQRQRAVDRCGDSRRGRPRHPRGTQLRATGAVRYGRRGHPRCTAPRPSASRREVAAPRGGSRREAGSVCRGGLRRRRERRIRCAAPFSDERTGLGDYLADRIKLRSAGRSSRVGRRPYVIGRVGNCGVDRVRTRRLASQFQPPRAFTGPPTLRNTLTRRQAAPNPDSPAGRGRTRRTAASAISSAEFSPGRCQRDTQTTMPSSRRMVIFGSVGGSTPASMPRVTAPSQSFS